MKTMQQLREKFKKEVQKEIDKIQKKIDKIDDDFDEKSILLSEELWDLIEFRDEI